MATWKAKCACTVPGGRFYAEGAVFVGEKAPNEHFALVGKPDPAPAAAEAPAPQQAEPEKSKAEKRKPKAVDPLG